MRRTLAKTVTRVLLGVLLFVGFGCLVTGCGQNSDVDNAFTVRFVHESDGCDLDQTVLIYLDVDNGKPLLCSSLQPLPGEGGLVPYFSGQQSDQILSLAAKLGEHGLSDADQQRVQDLVNSLAATLPSADRPYHYGGLWGTGLIWVGIGAMAIGFGFYLSPPRFRLESLIAGERITRRKWNLGTARRG